MIRSMEQPAPQAIIEQRQRERSGRLDHATRDQKRSKIVECAHQRQI